LLADSVIEYSGQDGSPNRPSLDIVLFSSVGLLSLAVHFAAVHNFPSQSVIGAALTRTGPYSLGPLSIDNPPDV